MLNKINTPAQNDTETGVMFDLKLFSDGDGAAEHTSETADATETTTTGETTQDITTTETTEETTKELVGAPEAYTDYDLPEGIEYNQEFAQTFNEVAKELNLTQIQAQRLVDLQAGNVKTSMELQAKQNAEWVKQSTKEHGAVGIEQANKTLARFSTPEYVAYLTESGQGNNPAVIAQWLKVSEMVSEDKSINGNATGSTKTHAQILYPSMK